MADGSDNPYAQYIKPASYLERLNKLNPPKQKPVAGLREVMQEEGQRGRSNKTSSSHHWPVRGR